MTRRSTLKRKTSMFERLEARRLLSSDGGELGTLIGAYNINYRYNAAGTLPADWPHPTSADGNPYNALGGAIVVNAAPGDYHVVITEENDLRSAQLWSGDASSGFRTSLELPVGSVVDVTHTFGQLVFYAWDWYPYDNPTDSYIVVDLYREQQDHLAVTTQPPTTVVVGDPFKVDVQVDGADGTPDPNYSGTVTLSLANNPGGATLTGATPITINDGSGEAEFGGLTLDTPGVGYTLKATDQNGDSATTNAFVADELALTTQPPTNVLVGTPFDMKVSAEDTNGNVDPNFTGAVTVALSNNPANATLGGTLTVNAVNGVADFPDLTLDQVGDGYTLQITSTSLTPVTTPFNVNPPQFNVNLAQSSFVFPVLPNGLYPALLLDQFNATFNVQAPSLADGGAVSTATANTNTNGGNATQGRLIEVSVSPLPTIPVAFATTSVTVTVFQSPPSSVAVGSPPPAESVQGTNLTGAHNVWLNQGPGAEVLEWYTPGFKTFLLNPAGKPILVNDTGPLEDWVDLGDPALNLTPQSDFTTIINQAEQTIESKNSQIVFQRVILGYLNPTFRESRREFQADFAGRPAAA